MLSYAKKIRRLNLVYLIHSTQSQVIVEEGKVRVEEKMRTYR